MKHPPFLPFRPKTLLRTPGAGGRFPVGRTLLAVALACLGAAGPLAGNATASHNRGLQIDWVETSANSAEFKVTAAYRCSAFEFASPCSAQVGDTFDNGDSIDFGDQTFSESLVYTVKAVNQAEDWILGDVTVRHDYASPGPFTASLENGDTIGELNNNPNGTYRAETIINFTGDDESPRTSVPPIVDVGDSGVQTWNVPAVDSGGETRRWRLPSAAENCGGCVDPHPPGLTIAPTTGRVTWDTTDRATGLWYTGATVEALDPLGNVVSTTQVNYLVRVGQRGANQAPDWVSPPTPADGTEYTAPPGSELIIDLQAQDPDAGHVVHIDNIGLPPGATFSSTDGNSATARFRWTPTSGQEGDYLLTVTAQDDQTPPAQAISRTYRIEVGQSTDTQPPQTTITGGPPGTTASTNASFTFSSSEANSSFRCRIDGGNFEPCSSPRSYSGLAPGEHTFEVRAADLVGNVDPTPAAFTWTIDAEPPDTPITTGPPAFGEDDTPSFTFGSTEPGSSFQCSLDGGPFLPCTSPFTTPELPPGRHTFTARAIDPAGNADPTPTVYIFEIAMQLSDLPQPVLGEEVNVGPVPGSGTVFVAVLRRRGGAGGAAQASQKGLTFRPLRQARQIPVGSFLKTRQGTVELVSATGSGRPGARTQSGRFSGGVFQVLQSRARRARGLTTLSLKGSSFSRCGQARDGLAGAAQVSRRTIRRVRSNAGGRFRTRGRNSAATVRGTVWITADRCDGTLTTVKRGRVAVRDFRRKRTVIVRAGKSYLARARR